MSESKESPPEAAEASDDVTAAPLPLRWVEELVNTRSVEFHTEDLATPQALGEWLAARGLAKPGTRVTGSDLDRALRVREGLRALIGADQEPGPPEVEGIVPGALADLEEVARELPLVLEVRGERPVLGPLSRNAVDAALGSLLAVVADAVANGTWSRMKVCRQPDCRWAYYDHSRNRTRAWCSMASCGNRAKGRAFRQRAR